MAEIDVGFVAKWLPRLFCILSFMFNPLLIYLVITQNKCKIGPYRQLLVCFALFDMTYSIVDVLVGMASHQYESSYSLFVSHGPLFENPVLGEIGVIIRCSFVGLSYGIFEIHFIYRYIVLCRPELTRWFTRPLYIFGLFLFWFTFGIYWVIGCSLIRISKEDRKFLRETFLLTYNVEINDVGLIGVRYKATNPTTILRTCIAMSMASLISVTVIVSYCVIGYKIDNSLNNSTISAAAKRVHRQLFLALIAQTAIPLLVSFLPCVIIWYTPLFGVNLGGFNNNYTIPMFSAFPFCDPIAIIVIFFEYRTYILKILGVKTVVKNLQYSSFQPASSLQTEPKKGLQHIKKAISSVFTSS